MNRAVSAAAVCTVLLGNVPGSSPLLAAPQRPGGPGLSGILSRDVRPEPLGDVTPGAGTPLRAESFLASPAAGDPTVYFVGCDPELGCEVYATDGTEEGTRLVRDVQPGPCQLWLTCDRRLGRPTVQLFPLGERVLFSSVWDLAVPEGSDVFGIYTHGRLYEAGPEGARAISATALVSAGDVPAERAGLLYFVGAFATSPGERPRYGTWRSDGTRAGTFELLDKTAGTQLQAFGRVFLSASDGLYETDGTRVGTRRIEGALGNRALTRGAVLRGPDGGERVVFADVAGKVWRTDGTETGTTSIATLPVPTASVAAHGSGLFIFVPGELWWSNGTAEGTRRVARVGHESPNGQTWAPDRRVVSGGRLFFVGNDGSGTGDELWVSDGTPEGTRLAVDLRSGSASPAIEQLTAFEGGAAFVALDASGARALHRSDGTAAGTSLLRSEAGEIRALTNAGGRLWFSASGGIWTSGGTPSGTRLAIRGARGASSRFRSRVDLPDRLLLDLAEARDYGAFGPSRILAVEGDGRTARPLASSALGDTLRLVPGGTMGGRALVVGRCGEDPCLGMTDGTADGTHVLRRDLDASEAAFLKGRLLFARPPTSSRVSGELWATDGTPAGTSLVAALPAPPAESGWASASSLVALGERVVFVAKVAYNREELWTSDGTAAGTHALGETSLFPSSSPVAARIGLVDASGGRARFTKYATVTGGREEAFLETDGTREGTRTLAPASGLLCASDGVYLLETLDFGPWPFSARLLPELWRTDGTPAGTYRVTDRLKARTAARVAGGFLVSVDVPVRWEWYSDTPRQDVYFLPDEPNAEPRLVTADGGFVLGAVNGRPITGIQSGADALLYPGVPFRFQLRAYDAASGRTEELGCFASTTGARPLRFRNVGSVALFAASDPAHGEELWRTDGTPEGTFRVTDLAEGPFPSFPEVLAVLHGRVLLLAADGEHGREPWSLPRRALDRPPADGSGFPCDEP